MALVEQKRRSEERSQFEVASACQMSQGHYSKLVRGVVPVGARARQRLEGWLAGHVAQPGAAAEPALAAKIASLAESIRSDSAKLLELARRANI